MFSHAQLIMPQSYCIFILTKKNGLKSIVIDVNENDTIFQVNSKVHDQEGIHIDQLYFLHRPLENESTLKSNGIGMHTALCTSSDIGR